MTVHRRGNRPLLTPEQGYHLAGLVDGEGCFSIIRITKRSATFYRPCFSMALREDDRPVLERFHTLLGVGALYRVPRPGDKWPPVVHWRVEKRAACLTLVDVFDQFPLWSKKARDFAIWREAVIYHNGPRPEGWAPMERWFHAIREIRKYVPGELRQPEFEEVINGALF